MTCTEMYGNGLRIAGLGTIMIRLPMVRHFFSKTAPDVFYAVAHLITEDIILDQQSVTIICPRYA